ncbi:hypothetical protein [Sphingobium yanoikuyae]|jgi:hypothetical protein|uniref:hypothetical protein n=1 Tax=Sphingobium yanoikuyae TaxID=13690 RepID=UPI0030B89B80
MDEIIRALDEAGVEFVGIEHVTDAQIARIREASKPTSRMKTTSRRPQRRACNGCWLDTDVSLFWPARFHPHVRRERGAFLEI